MILLKHDSKIINMATDSIDELVLRINCTDGTLYCGREFLLTISKTLQHLQDDCSTPINDVEVPFEKNIFGSLVKFANSIIAYTNPEISSNPDKLIQALDWLGVNKEIDKLVKDRLAMLPISKPLIIDSELLSEGITKGNAELFTCIAENGHMVLVDKAYGRDFDAIACNYTVFNNIDNVVQHLLNICAKNRFPHFNPPKKRNYSLIMWFEGQTYYIHGYGISENDYEYLFKHLKAKLKERGLELMVM